MLSIIVISAVQWESSANSNDARCIPFSFRNSYVTSRRVYFPILFGQKLPTSAALLFPIAQPASRRESSAGFGGAHAMHGVLNYAEPSMCVSAD